MLQSLYIIVYCAEPTEKAILKAWDFCAEKSRSIEVVYRDDDLEEEVLTRVHFNVNVEVRTYMCTVS